MTRSPAYRAGTPKGDDGFGKVRMRFVITGARGMLGQEVVSVLRGREIVALGHEDLDITDATRVSEVIEPGDVVVNCAAYTNVDAAEVHEDDAVALNAIGVKNLAIAARDVGARLVTLSTDYVFAGTAERPYSESETRNPISAYGRTKVAGEEFAIGQHPDGSFVVRTAWLYGAGGTNFAQRMLDLAQSKKTWSVVDDQLGQPTWSADLAAQIISLIDSDAPAGIYHGTNSGQASWFEFAQAVLEEAGLDPARITSTDSSSLRRSAPRPKYSVLGHNRWAEVGLSPMRPWREALHAAFEAGVFRY